MNGEKLLLIDGNSLIYRAYYALPLLTTAKGEYTNAVFGFTKMLMQIIEREQPDLMIVAMDKSAPTFRKEQYDQYKANRAKMPDELGSQLPAIRNVIQAYSIPILELAGYEADDVIGTMSRQGEEQGYEVTIITGDRDALQLVSDKTSVLLTKKGISELEPYDPIAIEDKYGVQPVQMIDVKGLMGDQSDNIPGVPGVGEKTALKLIQQFGSMEEVLNNIDQVKGKKLQEKLTEHQDLAIISKKLACIDRYVPLQVQLDDCRLHSPNLEILTELFNHFEFRSLLDKVKPAVDDNTIQSYEMNDVGAYLIVNSIPALEGLVQQLMVEDQRTAIVLHGNGSTRLAGLAVCWGEENGAYIDVAAIDEESLLTIVRPWLVSEQFKKYGHDYKPLYLYLLQQGIESKGFVFDTSLAAYLIDPSRSQYSLEDLCSEYLQLTMGNPYIGLEKGSLLSAQQLADYWVHVAKIVYRLVQPMGERLVQDHLDQLFYNVEIPLVKILAHMEYNGVRIDREKLEVMAEELSQQIQRLEGEIHQISGKEFNVNSPKQLGVILFEQLQLPVIKKTKTGYSTSADVLEALKDQHPIVDMILEYRQLTKLKSTYLDGMHPLIHPNTERIHTTFNQMVTATGRLSSTEPNLQNIPIRLEQGRQIRKMFIPTPGHKLLAADYSQIELRVLAHIANDQSLIETFQNNGDIHTRTAAEIFDVPLHEVTREMRDKAKTINFGIIYGMSDFRLARDIGVSPKQAGTYIKNYFARYDGVSKYVENVIEQAKKEGYVTTLLNRRRYIPDIQTKNRTIRQFAERTAVNTPIQGSAADIIKVAMVNVFSRLGELQLQTRMILQVHDELIFEVPEQELDQMIQLVKSEMEKAIPLQVPLLVDVKIGDDWYSVEKINVN